MLLIDGRQGSVDLIPLMPPELCQKRHLESGDAAFFGWGPDGPLTYPIGIEYKKVSEVISTITNKHFVGTQYPKMTSLYKRIYFVLEGEYREGSNGILEVPYWNKGKLCWGSRGWYMTYRQFDNWQNSLTETGKVIFKRSLSLPESAAQILDLYYLWTKDYSAHSSLFAYDKSQIPPLMVKPSLCRLVAAQLPGIGWKRSGIVATAFNDNVYDMVTAEESQWLEIDGIGKTLAKKIRTALNQSKIPEQTMTLLPSLQAI